MDNLEIPVEIIVPEGYKGNDARCITFTGNITSIGYSAFENCINLEEVNLPNSVTMLGADAFRGCTSLKCVTLGSGITHIYEGTFANCPNLVKVVCNSPNAIEVDEGAFDAGKNFFVSDEYTIPSDVYEIKEGQFANSPNLRVVHAHENIRVVGNGAFANCPKLETVFLGDSVTEMGDGVFTNCPRLTLQTHFNSLPYKKREGHRFSLKIVEGVDITNYPTELLARYDIIKNALNKIGVTDHVGHLKQLFGETTSGSPATKLIAISKSKAVDAEYVISGGILKAYNGDETDIILPNNIIGIDELAFYRNTQIQSITLPSSFEGFDCEEDGALVTDNAGVTFKCLPNLQRISISNSSTFYTEDGILYSCANGGSTYMLCCPAKNQASPKYNKMVSSLSILSDPEVNEALDIIGVNDKESLIVERLGEQTSMALVEVKAVFYGVDIKPKADAIIERYVLNKQLAAEEEAKTKATPEQKAAKALLFGKRR